MRRTPAVVHPNIGELLPEGADQVDRVDILGVERCPGVVEEAEQHAFAALSDLDPGVIGPRITGITVGDNERLAVGPVVIAADHGARARILLPLCHLPDRLAILPRRDLGQRAVAFGVGNGQAGFDVTPVLTLNLLLRQDPGIVIVGNVGVVPSLETVLQIAQLGEGADVETQRFDIHAGVALHAQILEVDDVGAARIVCPIAHGTGGAVPCLVLDLAHSEPAGVKGRDLLLRHADGAGVLGVILDGDRLGRAVGQTAIAEQEVSCLALLDMLKAGSAHIQRIIGDIAVCRMLIVLISDVCEHLFVFAADVIGQRRQRGRDSLIRSILILAPVVAHLPVDNGDGGLGAVGELRLREVPDGIDLLLFRRQDPVFHSPREGGHPLRHRVAVGCRPARRGLHRSGAAVFAAPAHCAESDELRALRSQIGNGVELIRRLVGIGAAVGDILHTEPFLTGRRPVHFHLGVIRCGPALAGPLGLVIRNGDRAELDFVGETSVHRLCDGDGVVHAVVEPGRAGIPQAIVIGRGPGGAQRDIEAYPLGVIGFSRPVELKGKGPVILVDAEHLDVLLGRIRL